MSLIGSVLTNLAIAYHRNESIQYAQDAYIEAIGIFQTLEDSSRLARLYTALGVLFKEKGTYSQAIHYYQKALNKF